VRRPITRQAPSTRSHSRQGTQPTRSVCSPAGHLLRDCPHRSPCRDRVSTGAWLHLLHHAPERPAGSAEDRTEEFRRRSDLPGRATSRPLSVPAPDLRLLAGARHSGTRSLAQCRFRTGSPSRQNTLVRGHGCSQRREPISKISSSLAPNRDGPWLNPLANNCSPGSRASREARTSQLDRLNWSES
jgi:hypothetical protein